MRISQALVGAVVAAGVSIGCIPAAHAEDGTTASPNYLFTISAERGRITGIGKDTGKDRITVRLYGVSNHATQFADRPFRDAYVLSTEDLAGRWDGWFEDDPPNAVLNYSRANDPLPHSIVLELDKPQYDSKHRKLTLRAWHLHRRPDPSPDATTKVPLPHRRAPARFIRGTLFIDSVEEGTNINGCYVRPGARCPGAQLSGADLSGMNLMRVNLTQAVMIGTNLSGSWLSGADLSDADLYGANLSKSRMVMTSAERARLTAANLSGAYLGSAQLPATQLDWADLSGANLTGVNLTLADLRHSNLRGAIISPSTQLAGANLSNAVWVDGRECAVDWANTGQCL